MTKEIENKRFDFSKMKKKDKILLIMGFYTISMLLIAGFIWDVMTPKTPATFNPITFLIITIGLSFVFHGFHPILLVRR